MCGIIGVISPISPTTHPVSYDVYRSLLTLQHRGQDSAGILSYDSQNREFFLHKDKGLVTQVFKDDVLKKLKGNMAIGHTRYVTIGDDDYRNIQPIVMGYPFGVGMAHNGNILNYHQLTQELQRLHDQHFLTTNDLELLLNLWCKSFTDTKKEQSLDFLERCSNAVKTIFTKTIGAYSTIGLMANKGLFAFRDPQGIRPLVMGKKKVEDGRYAYAFSSETESLTFIGFEYERNVLPGEFIFVTTEGEFHSFDLRPKEAQSKHCMFEWVYFSGAQSAFEDRSVYDTRFKLGEYLGKKAKVLIDQGTIAPEVVVAVPDTSRTSAIAIAEHLKLPYREGLLKNRYSHRSFILQGQVAREKMIEYKLAPVKSEIEGKKILLVDDSVVRGTTSKRLLSMLRQNGAKEITLAVACPPIRFPCYYGIDFPSTQELVASDKSPDQVAQIIGADSVIYLDQEDLCNAIGTNQLCMACLDKKYPTSTQEAQEFSIKRIQETRGK